MSDFAQNLSLQCSIEKRILLAKESDATLTEDLEAARASVKLLVPLCQKSNKTDVLFKGYAMVAQLEIAILEQDWETCKSILQDPAFEDDVPPDCLKRASGMAFLCS
jgi:hypothetical protein